LSERCEFQDPSTLEVMQQLRGRLPYIACLQPCAVPFHNEEGDSSAYQGYAIVPTLGKYDFVSIRESVASSIEQLRRLMSIAPHPQAQQKHLRAINWLRALRPNWEMAEHRRVSQEQSLKRT
jgi:hypothetical protein